MLDPEYIRKNSQAVINNIERGRGDPKKADIPRWLKLDSERSDLIQKTERLRNERNKLTGTIHSKPSTEIIKKGKEFKKKITDLEKKLEEVETEWQEILDWTPNMPLTKTAIPDGDGEDDNIILKAWRPDSGYIKEAENRKARGETEQLMPQQVVHLNDVEQQSIQTEKTVSNKKFTPLHHLDLGTKLGIIDNEQGAKTSGSRFTYLLGDLAKLQYAIQQLLFNELLRRDFTLFIPPLLVKDRALYGTSHFPEGQTQVYSIKTDYVEDKAELNLVGSTEPTNFAYFADRVLNINNLPFKLFAYAPAFRTEVGSWGKDTKGIKRMHQFDKIEMNCVCTPEQSDKVFNEFLSINEWLLQKLEIPYQLAQKCASDAGYYASAKQVDPEAWLSGQQEFMEVMTDTNATDYQARRLNIKFRDKSGQKHLVHTVNDTGVAMGRMLIAIMDNYQQRDGSILVPKALQKFTNITVLKKKLDLFSNKGV